MTVGSRTGSGQRAFRYAKHKLAKSFPPGHAGGVTDEAPPVRPEAMRDAVRDYVYTLHTTYLNHVRRLPPVERAALPLVGATTLTVVAAAARRLHLVATSDRLPPPYGPEVQIVDETPELSWALRFFDPSVLPDLGLLTDDSPAEVRRALGIGDAVYHLVIDVGGGLGGHHAQHSAVALANQDAKLARDLDRIRHAVPRRTGVVDEFATCVRIGLDRAAALLATELTGGRVVPDSGTPAASCVAAVLADVDR